jgi:hypothetical protein
VSSRPLPKTEMRRVSTIFRVEESLNNGIPGDDRRNACSAAAVAAQPFEASEDVLVRVARLRTLAAYLNAHPLPLAPRT